MVTLFHFQGGYIDAFDSQVPRILTFQLIGGKILMMFVKLQVSKSTFDFEDFLFL
jgi:hypothetical protein